MAISLNQALDKLPPEKQEEIINKLSWSLGELRHMTRPHGQRRLYDAVIEQKAREEGEISTVCINAHRRLGKSFMGVLFCIQRCLKFPNQIVRFAAPTALQCSNIVLPMFREILLQCPKELQPHKTATEWHFKNPAWKNPDAYSIFRINGVDTDNGERLRGQACDLAVLDEVREIRDLRYIVSDILAPQFMRRTEPTIILLTTPPKSMDHHFVTYYIPRAIASTSYHCIPASDNEDFTEADERMIIREMGDSKNSMSWKREVECKLESDPEFLITPEFVQKKKSICVPEIKKPAHYCPVTVMDGAYKRDLFAMIFGYVDFTEAKLVCLDSRTYFNAPMGEIAEGILSGEHECFGPEDARPSKLIRFADLDAFAMTGLQDAYKISAQTVQKMDKDAWLAKLRDAFLADKIRIVTGKNKQKNAPLVHALEFGVWNERRTDYLRTSKSGHWDAGQALIYMWRMVQPKFRSNPSPAATYNMGEFHISDGKDPEHEDVMTWRKALQVEDEVKLNYKTRLMRGDR